MEIPSNKDLRNFIDRHFSDAELDTFCFDYFMEVRNNFTSGLRKSDKVMDLIQYCANRELMDTLLFNLRQEREKAYQQTFAPQQQLKPLTPPPVHTPRARNPKQVFISHSSKDADLAQQIAADLKTNGYDIFITPNSIRPGEKWVPAIGRGLEESGIFIVLLTPNALDSGWVRDETNTAIALSNANKMRLFLLDVQACDPPVLWMQRQMLPFRGKEYEQNLANLLQAFEGKIAQHRPDLAPTHATPEPTPRAKIEPDQCTATTKSGSRCRNRALDSSNFCAVHTEKSKARPPQQPKQQPSPAKQTVASENTFIHEKTGLEFVRIPAGDFTCSRKAVQKKTFWFLGSGKTEYVEGNIELPEFWISKIPVTQAAYKQFIDANPRYDVPYVDADWAKPYNWDKEKRTYPADKADHPVVFVSWYDAIAFCKWAGLQLPTEEQWEKAARGKNGQKYPWGNNEPTDKLCNFNKKVGGTTPVGQYSPQGDSPYGCVDMSGNVWEWCLNKYKTPQDTQIDKSDDWRVLRGGSWYGHANFVRAACRSNNNPDYRGNDCGFRVVVVRPPSQ